MAGGSMRLVSARLRVTMLVTLAVCVGGVTSAARAAESDTRLADAAMRRDAKELRTLLGQKVDFKAPGTDGTRALDWAVRVDDVTTARLLLGAGATATLPNRYGVTPLAIAAANGSSAMM